MDVFLCCEQMTVDMVFGSVWFSKPDTNLLYIYWYMWVQIKEVDCKEKVSGNSLAITVRYRSCTSWSVPTCCRRVKFFVCLMNHHRRFHKDFSKIAKCCMLQQANTSLSAIKAESVSIATLQVRLNLSRFKAARGKSSVLYQSVKTLLDRLTNSGENWSLNLEMVEWNFMCYKGSWDGWRNVSVYRCLH